MKDLFNKRPQCNRSLGVIHQDSEGEASLCKGDFQQQVSRHSEASDHRTPSSGLKREVADLDLDLDVEDDPDDGDSFFDDPLPKPQKTYGW